MRNVFYLLFETTKHCHYIFLFFSRKKRNKFDACLLLSLPQTGYAKLDVFLVLFSSAQRRSARQNCLSPHTSIWFGYASFFRMTSNPFLFLLEKNRRYTILLSLFSRKATELHNNAILDRRTIPTAMLPLGKFKQVKQMHEYKTTKDFLRNRDN